MPFVLGLLIMFGLAVLLFGAVTGRIRSRSCCCVADPRADLRMRAAFAEDAPTQPHS